MAEDLLGGVLGGEDEQPETETPQAAAGAEAFAAAIAAIASRQDPGVARKTEVFLDKQARLLDIQARHLEQEHASRLAQLRLAVAAARRKRFADLMRNCLYGCIALLALGALGAVIRMTYEALDDHSLVVEDFTVPADFVARGITSQSLAEDLASRVSAIGSTQDLGSLFRAGEARTGQGGMLKVQIPETGISIDELDHFLHRWLGHEAVVNGELREDAGGQLSVVLYFAGHDPIVVKGSDTDLDGLMQGAAEKVVAIGQPPSYVNYLRVTGRSTEAYDAAAGILHDPRTAGLPTKTLGAVYAFFAGTDPDRRHALASALIGIDAAPQLTASWMEAWRASTDLGQDQAAIGFASRLLSTRRRDQEGMKDSYPWLTAIARVAIDQATGDFAALAADYKIVDQSPRTSLAGQYAQSATTTALLHDEAAARRELSLAFAASPTDKSVLQARWDVSSTAGDWSQALEAAQALVAAGEAEKLEAQKSAPQRPEFTIPSELELATQYRPRLALAKAMTGDVNSAAALIAQAPEDCYLCVRTRAKIAAAAGDAATADHWFAEGVRQAPDLPMAYTEWGQALLARGDLAGAARELSLAHDKGPHFADALKIWGDVLVKQGHPDQALSKYDEALKYAPEWASLKQAREAAAALSGH